MPFTEAAHEHGGTRIEWANEIASHILSEPEHRFRARIVEALLKAREMPWQDEDPLGLMAKLLIVKAHERTR